jgi:hypothetical protein
MYQLLNRTKKRMIMRLPNRHIKSRAQTSKISRPLFMPAYDYDKLVPMEKRQTRRIIHNPRENPSYNKNRKNRTLKNRPPVPYVVPNTTPQIQINRQTRRPSLAYTQNRGQRTRSQSRYTLGRTMNRNINNNNYTRKVNRNLSSMMDTFTNTTGCKSCRGAGAV